MKWLWFIGPLVFIFVFVIISVVPSDEEKRLRATVNRWISEYLGPLVGGKKKTRTSNRRVRSLPSIFNSLLQACGGGTRVTDVVLIPKLAYMAVRLADGMAGSNHFTVLCRLSKRAPQMLCRPLPTIDGRPAPNSGVKFEKDPDFMDSFVVEGEDEKAITKWLKPALREALMDLPEAWLRTDGRTMALTLYGTADADTLDELVAVADAIFAERGAGGGRSLFGDGEAPLEEATYRKQAEPARQSDRKDQKAPKTDDAQVAQKDDLALPAVRIVAGAVDLGLYAMAAVIVAAVAGKFATFHPSVLFNSPDILTTESWQGGWTTKGFAAFVAAEALLVGLFVYQSYLASRFGQSIGKRLLGARVVRADGAPMNFTRGVLLRSWLFGLVPLLFAAALTRPFSVGAFLMNIPRLSTVAAAAAVVALGLLSFVISASRRGIHDLVSGTRVVTAEPFRLSPLQLGVSGLDPVMFKRVTRGVAVLIGFVLLNLAAHYMDLGYWIY